MAGEQAFSRDHFQADKAHNSKASEEERMLCAKCVSELVPMGETREADFYTRQHFYATEEIQQLKLYRGQVSPPERNTVWQKIVDGASLAKYYCGGSKGSVKNRVYIKGFATKADDSVAFGSTPLECYENYRLDYMNHPFLSEETAVYAVRFIPAQIAIGGQAVFRIPYSEEFTNTNPVTLAAPFTGNGYIGTQKYVIPEYMVDFSVAIRGIEIISGAVYKISKDGEELFAVYKPRKGWFE